MSGISYNSGVLAGLDQFICYDKFFLNSLNGGLRSFCQLRNILSFRLLHTDDTRMAALGNTCGLSVDDSSGHHWDRSYHHQAVQLVDLVGLAVLL